MLKSLLKQKFLNSLPDISFCEILHRSQLNALHSFFKSLQIIHFFQHYEVEYSCLNILCGTAVDTLQTEDTFLSEHRFVIQRSDIV